MTNKSNTGKIVGGLGIAALAAAAATTYFFKGPGGKQRTKQAVTLAKKAKTEMLTKIKQMESVSKKTYEQAAKEVLAKYKQAKSMDPKDIADLAQELKGHWENISTTIQNSTKKLTPIPVKKNSKKSLGTKRTK